MKNTETVGAVPTINYQFTAIPTNLMMMLDNNCRSMLFTLIQLSTFYAESDGYYYRSNELLQLESDMSKNLVIATLDTLYTHGLIDVISVGASKGKKTNSIRVNFEVFKDYEDIKIDTILNDPSTKIRTVSYKGNYSPSYLKRNQECNKLCNQKCKKVNTNIDNINNIYNKENINKEYNIKNNISNIIREKPEALAVGSHASIKEESIIMDVTPTSTIITDFNEGRELLEKAKAEIDLAPSYSEADSIMMSYKPRLKEISNTKWRELADYFETSIKRFAIPLPSTKVPIESTVHDAWDDCLF